MHPAVGVYPRKPGDTFKDCRECPEMVVIPSGSFRMGDVRHPNEKPVHAVNIRYTFAVGKYEVTRGEFAAFVRDSGHGADGACRYFTGSEWKKSASKNWRDPGFRQTDRDPVVCVDWDDAKAYVRWLSRKTGQTYRLLSEAEWEYVARAGTSTKYWWGGDIGRNRANCAGCGSHWDNRQTAPAGSFSDNPFGLYDTVGNVWEWTEDCWHDNYNGAPADGSAWTTGGNCSRRVLRGGSQSCAPRIVRSAIRGRFVAGSRGYSFGFRVARTF